MAEVEIHTGHEASNDAFGQRVGIAVGVIGILLSIVTILGHREHNAAVVRKTEANDQWAYYQAKKIREHTAQTGATLLNALAADPVKVASVSAKLSDDSARYAREGEDIRTLAQRLDDESKHSERRALRLDLGEGFLELGLVMSSLYFLSRKRLFVFLGGAGAVAGTLIGILGWLS
jgi:Ser-tRNA(Ala) deacylase AlaX